MIFHSDDNLDPNAVSVIDKLEKENQQLKDENETLSTHNNDLLHEVRVLNNKIATFNQIYDESLRIDGNES